VQKWEKIYFKPTTGNESLHKNNGEGNRVMIFATSQKLLVKSSVPNWKNS
jgi:hypothetical protein